MDYTLYSAAPVLEMLIPSGGWACSGIEYENIQFLECQSITKAAYEQGIKDYPVWAKKRDEAEALKKTSLLARLGITAEEAAILLG
jgi:hypothetical protein